MKMVTIIFRYARRITLYEKNINYIAGQFEISSTETTTLTQLTQLATVVCGFSFKVVDYDFFGKRVRICIQSLRKNHQINFLKYVIPEVEVVRESKYEIGEEDESEVPGENKKEGEDSSVGYETKVKSSIDLVDCALPFFDDDTGIDVELSQPMTN